MVIGSLLEKAYNTRYVQILMQDIWNSTQL